MTKTWWSESPDEQLVETAWERQMNMAGIERYETSRFKKNGDLQELTMTQTGQKTTRRMIKNAITAIDELQKEMSLPRSRTSQSNRATVLALPSETLALITIRALLDRTYDCSSNDQGVNWQLICKEVGKAVEDELNFRTILKGSREQARVYAKELDKAVPKSFADKMIEEGDPRSRSLRRWKETFKDIETYTWDTSEKLFCGEALLDTVIMALPEDFTKHKVHEAGFMKNYAMMTDDCREAIDQSESMIASMQVIRKPMIRRPARWTKSEH